MNNPFGVKTFIGKPAPTPNPTGPEEAYSTDI